MGIGRPAKGANYPTQTTGDLTLYVRTTGSDANSGVTAGAALATIQAAIDKVPKTIRHDVTIDIGPGTFDGAMVAGKFLGKKDSGDTRPNFIISGTQEAPTTLDGSTSGTATAGSTTTVEDSGAGWTTNELRGLFVDVAGEIRVIRENTGTVAVLVGSFGASSSGKTYSILENTTIINSVGGLGYGGLEINNLYGTRFQVKSLKFSGTTVGLYGYHGDQLSALYCSAYNCTYGYFMATNYANLEEIYATGGTTGVFYQECSGTGPGTSTNIIFVYNSSVGIQTNGPAIWGLLDINACALVNNSSHGVKMGQMRYLDFDTCFIDNNGGYGIYYDGTAAGARLDMTGTGTKVVSNNTSGGIYATGLVTMDLDTLTGSGNGGYGLTLDFGATAQINSATAITGTTADATIDEGVTPLDWSTDFSSDGDKASNDQNYCLIERKD